MLRTALRPRWLALLAVVLIGATAMAWLGQWQLDRARQRSVDQAAAESAVPRPLLDVLRARQTFPGDAVGDRVVASGTWDRAAQLLVPGREQGGRTGYWVLTPLRLADGSAVGVVRGWVASPADGAASADRAVTEGAVEVIGRLEPAEPAAERAPGEASRLPAGQIDRIAVTDLIRRWPYPLLTGYVVLESQRPPGPPGTPTPTPVPAPPPETGLAWRNVSYALQWWAFAAFGLFLWWRAVRDDHASAAQRASGTMASAADGDGPAETSRQEGKVSDPTR